MSQFVLPALAQLLHLALVLVAAPLLVLVLESAHARLAGHRLPGPAFRLREQTALLRRPSVVADGVSIVFRHAPLARLAVLLAAVVLIPGFTTATILSPVTDLLLIAGLFALARAIEICAALDAGTGRAAHAALLLQRRAFWLAPALVLAIFTLAVIADASTRLDVVIASVHEIPPVQLPALALALIALSIAALADTDRAPFAGRPDPLGSTAWQDAYSGRDLALINLGSALRLLAWLDLLAALWPLPSAPVHSPVDWPLAILTWAAKLVVLAIALLVLEAGRARLRPGREGEPLGAAVLLGVLALVSLLALAGRA